jgi:translation initiation factor IF-3
MKNFNNHKKKREHKLNEEITEREVRVVDEGVMSLNEALKLASEQELDLVLINDKSTPVICRIINYEKFIYEQKKKKKNQTKPAELKEIKLGPNTSENDVDYRVKHIIEFLDKGHKVKLTMQFRGREMVHTDKGQELMLKIILAVSEHGSAETMPKLEGKKMFTTLRPKQKN